MAKGFLKEQTERGKIDLSVIARIRKIPAYMTDPSVSIFKKFGILLGVLYIVSPVDAISDFIPVLGWLDDIGVLGMMYLFMMKELSGYIIQRDNSLMQKA